MKKGIVMGAGALAVLVLGAWVYASPYLALRGLKGSIEDKNPQAMYDYIDFPMFKENLKQEMLKDVKQEKDNPFAEIGGAMVEGLVDMFVNPETLIKVFSTDDSDKKTSGSGSDMGSLAPKLDLSESKLKMGYTGLNSFELAMPEEGGGEWAFILHRKGLRWKIDDVRIKESEKSSSSSMSAAEVEAAAGEAQAVADAASAGDESAADAAATASATDIASGFEGDDVEGAPRVGSYDDEYGYFLLREVMEEPYWTDWYGMGGPNGMQVKANGKMMFEGTLLINCDSGVSEWENLDEYSSSEIVPAAAINNAKKIFCGN